MDRFSQTSELNRGMTAENLRFGISFLQLRFPLTVNLTIG